MEAIKLLLCLAVCGITCCAASHICNEIEYQKCKGSGSFDPSPVLRLAPLTEEKLMNYCNTSVPQIECLYNYEVSCEKRTDVLQTYELYKKIFGLLCDNKNFFRRKYIDNARCLNKLLSLIGDRCPVESIPDDANRKETCMRLIAAVNCAENLAGQKCGSDAQLVYKELYRSTYGFFVLRLSKCV